MLKKGAKKKEDIRNLEIVAIVGMVAIVAIFVLYLDNRDSCQAPANNAEAQETVGLAIEAPGIIAAPDEKEVDRIINDIAG